jgi:hypothetical protein
VPDVIVPPTASTSGSIPGGLPADAVDIDMNKTSEAQEPLPTPAVNIQIDNDEAADADVSMSNHNEEQPAQPIETDDGWPAAMILPAGTVRPFLGSWRSGPVGPSKRPSFISELVSHVDNEPETAWTPIAPSPFEE